MASVISYAPGGPYASGSSPIFRTTVVDNAGLPISSADLSALVLTIADTLTGVVINGCDQANILNIGRGAVGTNGVLLITLEVGDTAMNEVPGAEQVQRSLVIDWLYGSGLLRGRAQINFILSALVIPGEDAPMPVAGPVEIGGFELFVDTDGGLKIKAPDNSITVLVEQFRNHLGG